MLRIEFGFIRFGFVFLVIYARLVCSVKIISDNASEAILEAVEVFQSLSRTSKLGEIAD
jgi:hypothetical protein